MRTLLNLSVCLALGGCATAVPPAAIEKPERLEPIASKIENSKVIFISNLTVKLVDRRIGQLKSGTLCVGGQDLVWTDNPIALNSIREGISRTLSKNGYNVYSGLIQANGERDADILLGIGIDGIKANICYSLNGMKGDASLHLKFEIYDKKNQRSLISAGSGTASITEFSQTGDPDVFTKAAEMATENILAQDSFFKATRK
jgi:hypothetical protein